MKMPTLTGMFVSLSAVALLLGGCGGSYQARSVEVKNALLVNPDILEKGTGEQALYRYRNPKVNPADYNKILLEPVLVFKEAELSSGELENYKKLANNFQLYLSQEISKQMVMTTEPGPGTLRFQAAIVDADSSKPVRTILSFTPYGIGINLAKYATTGKQTAVGEITVEMKITDAQTGELLGDAIDRRVGGKNAKNISDVWSNADEALQYWANRLSYVLCMGKNLPGCMNPNDL